MLLFKENCMDRIKPYLIISVFILALTCSFFGKTRIIHVERAERMIFDLHYSQKESSENTGEIVLVLGGEASFSQLGAWPWPRKTHATLLGRLGLSRTVMFDILMPERTDPAQDRLLAKVIETMGNVVVAGHVLMTDDGDELILPYPELYHAAAEFGVTNINKDIDGLLRSLVPFRAAGGKYVASLPLANAAFLSGDTPKLIGKRQSSLVVGDRLIPISDNGNIWVRFSDTDIVQYEYIDVLTGRIPADRFAGKIVIVGIAASGASDFYSVPAFPGSRVISGAEYNARALKTLLWGDVPKRIPPWLAACICFLAAIAGAGFVRMKPMAAFFGISLILVVFTAFSHLSFLFASVWIDLAMPLISLIVSFSATQGLRYALVHKDWEMQSRSIEKITAVDIQSVNRHEDFSEYLKTIWEKFNLSKRVCIVATGVDERGLEPHFVPDENQLKISLPGPNQMRAGMAVPVAGVFGKREFVLLGWDDFIEKNTLKTLSAVILSNAWFFKSYKEAAKRKEVLLKAIHSIFLALDFRDPITGGHSTRVSALALALLEYMADTGLLDGQCGDENRIEDIYLGALVHDVGKIGIPDSILLKKGKLTDEEFDTIKSHPVIGRDIMGTAGLPQAAIDVMIQHHERFDGSGYPYGLKGKEISLGGRIVAVADVYDALTSDRPYRKGWSSKKTCDFIRSKQGTDFDPDIVAAFLKMKGHYSPIH